MTTNTESAPDRESSGSVGDEDVLHVVTNVYTIPIVKSSSSTGDNDLSQEIHISTSGDNEYIRSSGLTTTSSNRRCRERHEHVYGISGGGTTQTTDSMTGMGDDNEVDCIVIASPSQQNQPCEIHTRKTSRETRKITKRVIDEGDVTKSKFQIRSIVEIYENPVEQASETVERAGGGDQSTAFFKTSTQLNEFTTKETFTEPVQQRGRDYYYTCSLNLLYYTHLIKMHLYKHSLTLFVVKFFCNLDVHLL